MTSPFPLASRSTLGYDQNDVDEFLAAAREAYSADSTASGSLTAGDLRHTAFRMRRGGYSTRHVDAALERLEDAFAVRERRRAVAERGEKTWLADARATAQVVLNRLARPEGERFDRAGRFVTGYDVAEVDAFAGRLYSYFHDGSPLGADDVRTVAFSPQRGGYDEAQVDLVLDTVVDVILSVR